MVFYLFESFRSCKRLSPFLLFDFLSQSYKTNSNLKKTKLSPKFIDDGALLLFHFNYDLNWSYTPSRNLRLNFIYRVASCSSLSIFLFCKTLRKNFSAVINQKNYVFFKAKNFDIRSSRRSIICQIFLKTLIKKFFVCLELVDCFPSLTTDNTLYWS